MLKYLSNILFKSYFSSSLLLLLFLCTGTRLSAQQPDRNSTGEFDLDSLRTYSPAEIEAKVNEIYKRLEIPDTIDIIGVYETLKMGDIYEAIDLNATFQRLNWNKVFETVNWNDLVKDFDWNAMMEQQCAVGATGDQPPAGMGGEGVQLKKGKTQADLMQCNEMNPMTMMEGMDQMCVMKLFQEGKISLSMKPGDMESFCEMAKCIDFNKIFQDIDLNCIYAQFDLNSLFRNFDFTAYIEALKNAKTGDQNKVLQEAMEQNPLLKTIDPKMLEQQMNFDVSFFNLSETKVVFKGFFDKMFSNILENKDDPGYFMELLSVSFGMLQNVYGDSEALRYYLVFNQLLYENTIAINQYKFSEALKIQQIQKDVLLTMYQNGMIDSLDSPVGNARVIVGDNFEIKTLIGILENMGMVLSQNGDLTLALTRLDEAIRIRTKFIEQLGANLDGSQYLSFEFSEEERTELIHQYTEELPQFSQISTDMVKMEHIAMIYGDHPPIIDELLALEDYDKAIEVYRIFKDLLLTNIRNNDISPSFVFQNKMIQRNFGLKALKAIYANMAEILVQLGQNKGTQYEYYRNAPKALEVLEQKQWQSVLFTQIGQTYALLENYEYSLEYLEKAWQLLRQLPNMDYVILAQVGVDPADQDYLDKTPVFIGVAQFLARIYTNRKRPKDAKRILLEAKTVIEEREFFRDGIDEQELNDNLFKLYGTLGEIELLLGKEKAALEFFRECQAIGKRTKVPILEFNADVYLANFFLITQTPDSASQYVNAALKSAKDMQFAQGVATVTTKMGEVARQQGRYEEAMKWYDEAIDLATPLKQTLLLFELHTVKGSIYQLQEDYEAALSQYEQAMEVVNKGIFSNFQGEASRQITLEKFFIASSGAVSCALKVNQPEKGFRYIQETKARTLNELLDEAVLNSSLVPDSLVHQKEVLLVDLNTSLFESIQGGKNDSIRQIQADLLTQLEFIKVRIRESLLQQKTGDKEGLLLPTIADIQEHLQKDQVLIEYFVGQEVRAFVIRKDTFSVVPLGVSKDKMAPVYKMNRVLEQIQANWEKSPILQQKQYQAQLEAFYRNFWEPIENSGLVRKGSEVIIIPDAGLHVVPFDAVRTTSDSAHYLIDDYSDISFSPSAAILFWQLNLKPSSDGFSKDLLVVAKSDFSEYPKLPKIKKLNLNSLKQIYEDTDVLLDEAATKNNLIKKNLSKYRYLYFSTHAVINDSVPELSYLALTDQPLSLFQTFELDLNSEVVVLSACKTARGQFQRGAGVMGFTRALFYAGARSLVISLWPVADDATEILMNLFFQHLADGKEPVAALQQAKKDLRTVENGKYDNPFYWGAFVLFGNSGM